MPRIAPFRKMFSRPVSSGWKPVPTSSSEPTRPRTRGLAVGRLGDPREDLQQRALAGAVAADDADDLARARRRTTTWSSAQIVSCSGSCEPRARARAAPRRASDASRSVPSSTALLAEASSASRALGPRSRLRRMSSDDSANCARCGGRRPGPRRGAATRRRRRDERACRGARPAEHRPAEALDRRRPSGSAQ